MQNANRSVAYGIFGYNLCNSRYLMIYDLYGRGVRSVNAMITFDFQTKIWRIHNDIWPVKSWCKGHALIKSKHDEMLLQTMGGCDCKTSHLFIKLSLNIDWSIERLLWIAHLKNDKQSQLCPLATVPKDIILLILKFFKKDFVFS